MAQNTRDNGINTCALPRGRQHLNSFGSHVSHKCLGTRFFAHSYILEIGLPSLVLQTVPVGALANLRS